MGAGLTTNCDMGCEYYNSVEINCKMTLDIGGKARFYLDIYLLLLEL